MDREALANDDDIMDSGDNTNRDEDAYREALPRMMRKSRLNPSNTAILIGQNTDLHKASVPLKSNTTGTVFNIQLSELLAELEKKNFGEEAMESIPGLVDRKGVAIPAEMDHLGGETVKGNVDIVDDQDLPLGPRDFNSMLSMPNFFTYKIDFEILRIILTESNLGRIKPLMVADTSKVGFEMTLTNKMGQFYTVEHDDMKPIQVFSAFFPAFFYGLLSKDLSGGTNGGWGIKKTEWIKEGFKTIMDASAKKNEIPLLLNNCDLERMYIDQSTAMLIRSIDALPYTRIGISFSVDKIFGFIHEMTVVGYYERVDFKEIAHNILLLLEDFKNFRDTAEPLIVKLNAEMEKEIEDLRSGQTELDITELYRGLSLNDDGSLQGISEKILGPSELNQCHQDAEKRKEEELMND